MTAVDRPDNGQDEALTAADYVHPTTLDQLAERWRSLARASDIVAQVSSSDYGRGLMRGHVRALDRAADELLALLGGQNEDQPDQPATCSDRHTDGDLTMFCEQIPGHVGPHVNHRIYW